MGTLDLDAEHVFVYDLMVEDFIDNPDATQLIVHDWLDMAHEPVLDGSINVVIRIKMQGDTP